MRSCVLVLATVLFSFNASQQSFAAAPEGARSATSFDTTKRVLWTTGNVQGSPEPPDPFTTENAFPNIRFVEPLSVGLMPGGKRFGVATRPGKVFTFEISPTADRAQLMIDIQRTVYGFAFHPQFATNGYFYLTYVLDPKLTEEKGSRLSRFQVKPGTLEANPSSEKILLEWPSGGHNGGCLRFGPDGYLYLSTGDGSGIADGLLTGQDTSDLLGAILRIDVDHSQGSIPYSIPSDNPFVGQKDSRGEAWSIGHRQVWKFSFDRQKRLWAGEVGQDLWEMVYLIQRGGNYGWSVREGLHPFRPERRKGPGPFIDPLVEHPHSDFRSLTGGYVFESTRLPELKGAYVYGDYDTGKLWSFKLVAGKVTEHRQLTDTQIRIVEFAQDDSGEVFLVDFVGGGLHKIVKAPPAAPTKPFPRKLSETGLFASTKDHSPAPG
ncbi:MAG: PQQ-dependent sugar dehydrogenase, partial [Planctomycetes bacterium]|nr:PQQ-dependent sugar dehydrogenase [Planctomycetota bacterium]